MDMPTDHHEVEIAFSPGHDAELPDLTALPGVASVGEPVTHDLEATYLDTADLALLCAGVTLRRRTGGTDEGWHLKVPSEAGRDEVHRALGRSLHIPPVALTRMVTGWTRGVALAPVALVRTTRQVHSLRDTDGVVLAELADDRVTGTPIGPGSDSVEWREWELELVDGNTEILEAAHALFAEHQVPPSEIQLKVARVLNGQFPDTRPRLRAVGPDKPAERVLARRLVEQVDELLARDHAIRRRDETGVHGMRKACRRLRGALATYRPLVDSSVTDPIRDELRWLARALSDARDAQVVFDRLSGLVAEQPRAHVIGPVRGRLRRSRAAADRDGRREVGAVLDSQRYFRLLRSLEALAAAPPWLDQAGRPAVKVLPRRVHKDWKRLRARHERAIKIGREDGGVAYDVALHDIRKAAKRLRYACEVAEPVCGKDAERLGSAAHEVTEVLGERQDTVMSRQILSHVAKAASAANESTFTFGLLYAQEERAASGLEQEYAKLWDDLSRRKLRRWLRA